jgi:hypothetical protein
MIVQNLKEGRDREEDEYLNNVDLLGGDMIVIEVCFYRSNGDLAE